MNRERRVWRRLIQIVKEANDLLKKWGVDDTVFLAREGERTPFQFEGKLRNADLILKKTNVKIGTYCHHPLGEINFNTIACTKLYGRWCRRPDCQTKLIKCSPSFVVAIFALFEYLLWRGYIEGGYFRTSGLGLTFGLTTQSGVPLELEFRKDGRAFLWDEKALLVEGQPNRVIKKTIKLLSISAI